MTDYDRALCQLEWLCRLNQNDRYRIVYQTSTGMNQDLCNWITGRYVQDQDLIPHFKTITGVTEISTSENAVKTQIANACAAMTTRHTWQKAVTWKNTVFGVLQSNSVLFFFLLVLMYGAAKLYAFFGGEAVEKNLWRFVGTLVAIRLSPYFVPLLWKYRNPPLRALGHVLGWAYRLLRCIRPSLSFKDIVIVVLMVLFISSNYSLVRDNVKIVRLTNKTYVDVGKNRDFSVIIPNYVLDALNVLDTWKIETQFPNVTAWWNSVGETLDIWKFQSEKTTSDEDSILKKSDELVREIMASEPKSQEYDLKMMMYIIHNLKNNRVKELCFYIFSQPATDCDFKSLFKHFEKTYSDVEAWKAAFPKKA